MRRLVLTIAGLSACVASEPSDTEGTATLTVSDRANLVVEVADADGAPVPDGWVVLAPGGRDAPTDAQGEATFENLGPGDWTAIVSGPNLLVSEVVVHVDADDARVSVELEPAPGVSVSLQGAVSDPTGAPAAGVTVEIDGATAAVTDATGAWAVSGLEGGPQALILRPPAESSLVTTDVGEVDVETGGAAWVVWQLAAMPPDTSRFIGTAVCVLCHADVALTYEATAHARASRSPEEIEAEPDLADLAASFAAADVVPLDVPGATLALADVAGWQVTVADAFGATSGPLPVLEVYGGFRAGAAIAVDAGGTVALVPAAWALAGAGLSSAQLAAGWVPGWSAGWFDAAGHLSLDANGAPGPEASFALQCAGCHATGAGLTSADGAYALEPSSQATTFESQVGCEACHDRGGAHSQAIDDRTRTILNPGRLHPEARVEVCARCHERTVATAHPFEDLPGWPVDATGAALGPLDALADVALVSPIRWLDVEASRVGWDQVGDFRTSPHRTGEAGYLGACEDCHDPHGSEHAAGLRADPSDNNLCVGCHVSGFPDEMAQADHAHHTQFAPGPWSPGGCVGCHLPRTGVSVRTDAVSGAGELHSHVLTLFTPDQSLAEFDTAGLSVLPRGEVPVPACLDCHLQADALAEDAGSNCPCPVGDPTRRETYEGMQAVYDFVWGGG